MCADGNLKQILELLVSQDGSWSGGSGIPDIESGVGVNIIASGDGSLCLASSEMCLTATVSPVTVSMVEDGTGSLVGVEVGVGGGVMAREAIG